MLIFDIHFQISGKIIYIYISLYIFEEGLCWFAMVVYRSVVSTSGSC